MELISAIHNKSKNYSPAIDAPSSADCMAWVLTCPSQWPQHTESIWHTNCKSLSDILHGGHQQTHTQTT